MFSDEGVTGVDHNVSILCRTKGPAEREVQSLRVETTCTWP